MPPVRRRHRTSHRATRPAPSAMEMNELVAVAIVILTGWGECFRRPPEECYTAFAGTPTDHLLYGLGWYGRYLGRFLFKCLAVATLPLSVWVIYWLARRRRTESPVT